MNTLRLAGAGLHRAKIGDLVKDTTHSFQRVSAIHNRVSHCPCLSTRRAQEPYPCLTVPGCKRSFAQSSCLFVPRGSPRGGVIKNIISSQTGKAKQEGDEIQSTLPHGNPELVHEFIKSAKSSPQSDIPPEFPSDFENAAESKSQDLRRDQSRGSFRPKIDPEETSVLLFPGQGSQFVGMAQKLIAIPKVQELFEHANDILGYDLLDICLNGPKEKLDKTIYCQPAVFVTSLGAVEKLKEENEQAIEHCIATAGFSVGEFAALVFAGSLSFETGLEIVRERAAAMQAASEDIPSGMMTAFLGPDNKIKMACHTAKVYCIKELGMDRDHVDCAVANYLYPECKVIAGNVEALDFIDKNSKEFGIRRVKRIPVSGAFHTKLMYPARAVLDEALSKAQLKPPMIGVHSNVDAYRYGNVHKMKKLLSRQVCEPVKWEQILHKVYERKKDTQFPKSFEVGPGRQLGAILKMTNNKAYLNYRPVDV